MNGIKPAWSLDIDTISRDFNVNPSTGLTQREAEIRLAKFGPNSISEPESLTSMEIQKSFKKMFSLFFLFDIVLFISLVSTTVLICGFFTLSEDGGFSLLLIVLIIFFMIKVLQIYFGINVYKLIPSLLKLSEAEEDSVQRVRIIRETKEIEIDSRKIVPGDILILGPKKEVILADARLFESEELAVMETMLTGSSEASPKDASTSRIPENYSAFKEDIPNMVFSNTEVYKGKGKTIVVATGDKCLISQIITPINLPVPKIDISEVKYQRFLKILAYSFWIFFVIIIGLSWLTC